MSESLGTVKQIDTTRIGTIAAGTSDERIVFVAPYDCVIKNIYMTNAAALAAHASNYTTFNFENKGAAGSGTDNIAEFTTASGGDNASFTAFLPLNVADQTGVTFANTSITKGQAITLTKTDAASGVGTDNMNVSICFVPQAGLKNY